jgi:hypothetical protein
MVWWTTSFRCFYIRRDYAGSPVNDSVYQLAHRRPSLVVLLKVLEQIIFTFVATDLRRPCSL